MPKTSLLIQSFPLLLLLVCGAGFVTTASAASPNMIRIHTWTGEKHFGPLIDENDKGISIFDIAAATTINIEKDTIKTKNDKIDEVLADSYVPFASYAAWKLSKILHTGRLEATIVHNSEKGVFVNCGSDDGIEANRRCVLLGDPETIVDPTTDEVLGVIREQLGSAIPLAVVSERLSKLNFPEPVDEDAQKVIDAFAVKRQVEIEQQTKRVVLAPPRWKPTGDAESLEDDANFLHAHLIAELVRYGFTVVSKKQTELTRQQIADKRQIEIRDVPDIEIAKEAKADVLVSVDMLAKGITCQVQLQVTDLKTDEYLGIVSGSTRRKEQKEESARAVAFAQGVIAGKQIGIRLNSRVATVFALADAISFDQQGKIRSFAWTKKPISMELISLIRRLETLQDLRFTGTTLGDQALSQLTSLTQLRYLGLQTTRVSDRGCKIIASNFPRLTHIDMQYCKVITEIGISHLAGKEGLQSLRVSLNENLGDEAASFLAGSPHLKHIDMGGCSVTDRGLASFSKCDSLERLNVKKTKVTATGVQAIKTALPNCKVNSDF